MTQQRGVEHAKGPVVPNATHVVSCVCGYRHDVVASDLAVAVQQFIERHKHDGARLTAEPIPRP